MIQDTAQRVFFPAAVECLRENSQAALSQRSFLVSQFVIPFAHSILPLNWTSALMIDMDTIRSV